jgi:hypothetical protein
MRREYEITFTRYDSRLAKRVNSCQTNKQFGGFDEAVDYAQAMLRGMHAADPKRKYAIECVRRTGVEGAPRGTYPMNIFKIDEVES